MSATITCAPAPEPGRVRCAVEARVASPAVLQWGDVEIVSTPDFVAPLRGRIGPRDATSKEPEALRWGLALVARNSGTGEVRASVRVVACVAERCTPYVARASGRVVVGR